MLNLNVIKQPIGPSGEFGMVSVDFVNGQLVSSVTLSPKAALDAAAKDLAAKTGSVIPAEVAVFLEGAVGLA
jgi:hypothetical protein